MHEESLKQRIIRLVTFPFVFSANVAYPSRERKTISFDMKKSIFEMLGELFIGLTDNRIN